MRKIFVFLLVTIFIVMNFSFINAIDQENDVTSSQDSKLIEQQHNSETEEIRQSIDLVTKEKSRNTVSKNIYTPEPEPTVSEIVYSQDMYIINGFWLPSTNDDFVLSRRATTIHFCLEEDPPKPLSLNIYEENFDNLDNVDLEDYIYKFRENDFGTGIRGKGRKISRGNTLDGYYGLNLKGKDLSKLKEGNAYILAVMVGEKLLAFNEDTPAILHFTVSDDGIEVRKNTRISILRCGGITQNPRYDRNDNR